MSGTKTITNHSGVALSVVLRGRRGAEPNGGDLPPVSGHVEPDRSITLQYGNDQNPYLNSLQVEENSNGSDVSQTYQVLSRGGPGTLDNLFNTNSTLVITYSASNYSFTLSGSN
ncbi:MAG: hypothetical protein WDN69_23875 [Aliidongia sp.]